MLNDIFNSVTGGADDNEDVAELVVTALGSSGTHYICWKTSSGEYRQRSHGLPTRLQEWLFPPNGTTRDFATLQVVLLGGNGFLASDKDGEIRNDGASTLKELRRTHTFHEDSASSSTRQQRRLSRGRDLEQSLDRPRASTLPATLSRENVIATKQLRPLLSHSRTPSVDKPRLGPSVPVALRRQSRASPIRPISIGPSHHVELEVLKEQPTPRPSVTPQNSLTPRHDITRYNGPERREEGDVKWAQQTPIAYHRPSYADSSTQTEPEPEPTPEPTPVPAPEVVSDHACPECGRRLQDSNAVRDSVASFDVDSKLSMSYTNSRRSSIDTGITRPDSECYEQDEQEWAEPPPMLTNPIVMGRMWDYFKSPHYVLGQAIGPQGWG
ncbi:hypothetical protein NUW58_g8028 [Xylaria curta]|uniref:Uncharacterized protein n=1 Tax=Xylaria curta TaxID=42375 RepID=A0ACC1NBH8_9PEZI|nr:hypothetical protein NUW58_g8028 [Xylaria curta]